MIHIDSKTLANGSIVIKVEGRLNRETIAPLTEMCERFLADGKTIALDIEGITHTDESGGEYISSLKSRVKFTNASEFLRLKYQLKLDVGHNI